MLMGQEDKKTTWNLIAKKLMGEASPEELQELERLLKNNPDLHYPMQMISDLWKSSAGPDKEEAETAFSRHLDRIKELNIEALSSEAAAQSDDPQAPKRSGRRLIVVLAGFIIASSILVAIFHGNSPHPGQALLAASSPVAATNEIHTTNGSRTHLTLPDGTLVWLNAGSTLSYPKNYNTTQREVSLTGEAFFDVAHNSRKPFLIHMPRIDIRVLGTSFNVKSYPTEKATETTLIHGSIEVSIKDRPNKKIILKPNEKLVVTEDEEALSTVPGRPLTAKVEPVVVIRKPTYERSAGVITETSWVDNKLAFQGETFGDLAKQMERWYGITIHFTDPGQEDLRFTGIFENETIRQALNDLKLTAAVNFNYSINGNEITIFK